jgi:hypothetical protein
MIGWVEQSRSSNRKVMDIANAVVGGRGCCRGHLTLRALTGIVGSGAGSARWRTQSGTVAGVWPTAAPFLNPEPGLLNRR